MGGESPTRRAWLVAAVAAGTFAATGSAVAAAIPIGDPPADMAQIVFFRRSTFFGSAISPIVREGKVELGRLAVGNYFIAMAPPGLHTYHIQFWDRRTMQIQVEAGETYYIELEVDEATLTPAEQRQFEEAAPKLRPSKPLAAPR